MRHSLLQQKILAPPKPQNTTTKLDNETQTTSPTHDPCGCVRLHVRPVPIDPAIATKLKHKTPRPQRSGVARTRARPAPTCRLASFYTPHHEHNSKQPTPRNPVLLLESHPRARIALYLNNKNQPRNATALLETAPHRPTCGVARPRARPAPTCRPPSRRRWHPQPCLHSR